MEARPSARWTARAFGAWVALLWAVSLCATATASAAGPNSADRLVMWTGCDQVVGLSDEELDLWQSRGVDGFACMARHLWGMGGTQNFSADPEVDLARPQYSLQRNLRDSEIVARAAARGMKMYLGVHLVNYYNTATPLRDWFDDDGWSSTALPAFRDLAGAANRLGFAGLAFDQELYPQTGGARTATWDWNYPGNHRSEQEVRAKARQRGRELMTRILSAFPGAELLAYQVELPQTWGAVVQKEVNGYENAYAERLDIDFWNGLSSVEGYRAIRFIDATFYKTPHIGTWDAAFRYHYNRVYSLLSRRLSNWSYAASRLHVSPFSWITSGPSPALFDDARSVSHVTAQLQAFSKWGMGREFANFAYGGLQATEYSPYADAMSASSTAAIEDAEPPALTVVSAATTRTEAAHTALRGTTGDNLAVRAVRWTTDRGHSGTAELTWRIESGDARSGYTGEMLWSIPEIPLAPGANTIKITVEDIKGMTSASTVIRDRTGLDSPRRQPATDPGASPRAQPGDTSKTVNRWKRAARRRAAARRLRCLRQARARSSVRARRVAARRCAKRHRRQSGGVRRSNRARRASAEPRRRAATPPRQSKSSV